MLDAAVASRCVAFAPSWSERRLFSAVLDCFDTGVVLLQHPRDVVHANDAMRALEPLGVFRLERRSMQFTDRAASEAFDDVLRGLPAGSGTDGFVARDPGRNHALFVRVVSGATAGAGDGGHGAIVLATDPDGRTAGDGRLFQIALGLSRAESAVAAALVRGPDAKEAALHLHVSHETVRTHLNPDAAAGGSSQVRCRGNTGRDQEAARLSSAI